MYRLPPLWLCHHCYLLSLIFITHNKLCLSVPWLDRRKTTRKKCGRRRLHYSQYSEWSANRTRPNPIRSVETSTKKSPQEEEALQKPQTEDRRHGKETASFNGLVIICCAQRSKIILTPWQYCCSFRLASLLVEKCARSCHCDFTLSPRFSRRRLLVCQP